MSARSASPAPSRPCQMPAPCLGCSWIGCANATSSGTSSSLGMPPPGSIARSSAAHVSGRT
eukprot:1708166-Lingulodinium_polyedra.AAC.1